MKASKTVKCLGETTISSYEVECPYCSEARIYRWYAECLASGEKCKCCKKTFAITYDHHEDFEDGYGDLYQCNKCDRVHNMSDIRNNSYEVTGDGKLITKELCSCGGSDFKTITVEEDK